VQTSLKTLLKSQLEGHAKLHLHGQPPQAHVVSSGRHENSASDAFRINDKLVVYTASCGAMARGEIQSLKRDGIVVLVTTSSGLAFHVEVGGSDKERSLTRVSSGAIVRDLEKAIRRASKRSSARGSKSVLQILRVPSMHVSAVWVHHPKKSIADVFVPYTANFATLRPGRTYKLQRIQFLLKKEAIRMILRWYNRYEKSHIQSNA